jgi:DNA adenine methylase
MARYHGGKQLNGRRLATYMLEFLSEGATYDGYCEPFCGMLGVYRHMYPALDSDANQKFFLAGDINASVIEMWKKAQTGWTPPATCSESDFMKMKYDGQVSAEKGFLGHQLSFGGVYFASYIGRYGGQIYHASAANKVQELATAMPKIKFETCPYEDYSHLKNFIIYCDPPYKGTTQRYQNEQRQGLSFDHEQFWDWVRRMSTDNIVFVSEYASPNDFVNIADEFSKKAIDGKHTKDTEKLFVHETLFLK